MTTIYCYGDITYEQHIHVDEYGKNNDSLVNSVKSKVGGSAFNTANGLAKMGHKVNLICSIGTDIEGKYLKKYLNSINNINTEWVDFNKYVVPALEKYDVYTLYRSLREYLKSVLEQ